MKTDSRGQPTCFSLSTICCLDSLIIDLNSVSSLSFFSASTCRARSTSRSRWFSLSITSRAASSSASRTRMRIASSNCRCCARSPIAPRVARPFLGQQGGRKSVGWNREKFGKKINLTNMREKKGLVEIFFPGIGMWVFSRVGGGDSKKKVHVYFLLQK